MAEQVNRNRGLPGAGPAQPEMPAGPAGAGVPRIAVEELLGEGREALLLHNGEAYRLRITANNKLILTK